MFTKIFGLLLSVRNCYASMKMARADSFAVALVRGEAIVATFRRKYHQFTLSIYAGAARSFVE